MSLEDIEQDYDVSDTETVRALSQSLDLPVCVADDPLPSEAVNEMKQSSTVETTEESFPLIINFLQNLTEEQWSAIRDGIYDPLTKQQLAGLCLRIVQFLSDKLMQIIIPGLYKLLGIQDADTSPLSQRSVTGVEDDKANTKSRVRFTEAGVPKRRGSRKSYTSIPTPYPSSNCMNEEEQESQHFKFKEIYLTEELRSLGSGSYCPKPLPMPARRSQTSLSEVQKTTTNSESLQVLLGLSEDTLVTCVQDSLQQSISKLACISDSPSGSAGTPKITPAVMAEVVKDVKSAVSVVVKSASASQTSRVTPVWGDSQTKVTEGMVREFAAKLEKVDQESKSLTGQVMTTISDTMMFFVDKNEQDLLDDLKDKITFLASHGGFIDDLDVLIRKYESRHNIIGSGSSCTLTSKSIQKLSSREFQTSAVQAVSGVLAKKVSSLSFPSSVVQSELTGAVSSQTLSDIVKRESILPVGSAASLVKAFVSDIKSLADSKESPQQKSAWSAAVHIYHSIQNNLNDYFAKLPRFAIKKILTSNDDNITHDEFKETVPCPCLDMKYRPSKSEPQLPESTGEVTSQRGISESSKLPWAQTDSEESKLLLTTCTKEVISELLVLYNTEMSNEDHTSTAGEKGSDLSIEKEQFVEGVLAQLGDISHSRAPSPIVCEIPFEIEDIGSKATASLTSLLDCMKKHSSEEFKRNATQAVSEFLVAQPAYSEAFRSGSIQNQSTWSKDIFVDSAAVGIIDTFVEDLQNLTQPSEEEQREPDLLENAQKPQSRIWSATTSLYNNMKKTLKDFTIHRRRSDVQSRMSSHTPTEDPEHLGTKEHLCSASQDLSQASKSVPHFPSLNLVALHRGVSESSKLLWTETDEGLMTNSTKEVISTILTSCEDEISNEPLSSTVGKKISDVSLEVNVFVGGVMSQLKNISMSRSPTPCEDMFECLQDSLERTYPVSLDCNAATSKGIASSHSLSTKSLQKLSSHEFQTKAEQGVSELLTRSFNIVEEGTTDKYLQSVSTSTTSTDIIQTIVKDLQELTQTTQSSDMVSGTSLLTTGQVSEKRIWSVARNVYHSLQSKIKEFLRKDVQRSDTTLGSIQIFQYGSSSSPRASLCHLEVNQSSVTPGGKDACVDIPHELLPTIKSSEKVLATTELSGSMLEDIGTIRRRSADSQKTRKTSSSRSSISPTPTSKSRQSEWDFALPGTPIPTELPAQSDCPIIRNMIIEDLFHTEDLLPVTFVDRVRQAAGVVVDKMVESVENTQEDEQDASHPDDLRSAVRKLRRIISTGTIHTFSHEFVDKVIAIQDSHSSPHVLTLAAAKSASDSILSRMKWGKKQCSVSRKHSTQILQIFAEETLRGFLKQWSDEYEDINFDVSVQNKPSTSTCMVIPIQLNQSKPEDSDTMNQLTKVLVNKIMDVLSVGSNHQMITKATAKCSFESGTSMATSDIVEGVLDLVRDTTSSTGEQIPISKAQKIKKARFSKIYFNRKGSKKVSKDLCPQESMEYQPQNTSPNVYFTESMKNSHGSLAPEGNDIAHSFPPEEKGHKPSLFTRMCRAITRGFSNRRKHK